MSKFEDYLLFLEQVAMQGEYGADLSSDEINKIRQKEGIKYNTDKGHPTQIKGTETTYRKILEIIPPELKKGEGLDYSAGRAHGTEYIKSQGHNIEAYEPFPNQDRIGHIDHVGLGSLPPNKQYDYIICSCVLNVVPIDIRDSIVNDIWKHLKVGGSAFITTRGKDVLTVSNPVMLSRDNMEVIVRSTGAYQKGFTNPELRQYIKGLLPNASIVSLNVSSAAVKITKDADEKSKLMRVMGKHLE